MFSPQAVFKLLYSKLALRARLNQTGMHKGIRTLYREIRRGASGEDGGGTETFQRRTAEICRCLIPRIIPIIVVSARPGPGNQKRAFDAGAKAFLQKPVDDAELLAVIRQARGERTRKEGP